MQIAQATLALNSSYADASANYQGDYIITVTDDVTIVQELDDIVLNMSLEG
jgi:hypothetical protein